MAALPLRLEAYDISNFAGQDTVGSMIVFVEGSAEKSDYRKFKIALPPTDRTTTPPCAKCSRAACSAMWTATRSLRRCPMRFMIDGGLGHVHVCKEVLDSFGLSVPCFGMVKDDHHRTRALVAPDGRGSSASRPTGAVRARRPDAGGRSTGSPSSI